IDGIRGKSRRADFRTKGRAARRRTMLVEALEARALLTILFTPQQGPPVLFPAGVPGSGTVEVNDFSDPPDGFSKSRLDDVVSNAIDNLGLPEEDDFSNGGFYLVFTPPNISSFNANASAFHTATTDFD